MSSNDPTVPVIPGKMAIPRLQPPPGGNGGNAGKSADTRNRVTHACEPCRQKKTKCSGEKPSCKHCLDYGINCFYGDGKRDRAKNEMANMQAKLEQYERLLERMGAQAEPSVQLAINQALGRSAFPLASGEVGGEALAPGDAGSTGSLDHITEGVTSEEGNPMGFVGKPSTRAWIQRAAEHLEDSETAQKPTEILAHEQAHGMPSTSPFRSPLTEMNEDPDLSVAEDQINVAEFPTREVADTLLRHYFETVNPFFPIVRKSLFLQQVESLYGDINLGIVSRKWIAIFNLIMAISAVYAHTIRQPQGDPRDHLQYYARARLLALDGSSIFAMPDLQQVQVAALTTVYMIATNQLDRAWNVNGLAIRYGQTLGLNLSNESSASRVEKDIQSRLWYSIRSLERLLVVVTGRPLGVRENDCTTRLPKADEDEMTPPAGKKEKNPFEATIKETHLQPRHGKADQTSRSTSHSSETSSSRPSLAPAESSSTSISTTPPNYFAEADALGKMTEECLHSIYSPVVVTNSRWIEVQTKIADLEAKLAKWKAELHPDLDFSVNRRDRSFVRAKMALGMQYHHLRMLINRPCLCGRSAIPNESNMSKDFSNGAARACVEEARNLINLIPAEPNTIGLTSIAPWWNLLNYLTSAGAIIILEISLECDHFPSEEEKDQLMEDADRVLRWLKAFGEDKKAAKASWVMLANLLSTAAAKIGRKYPAPEASPDSAMAEVEGEFLESFGDIRPMIPSAFPNFTPGAFDLNFPQGFHVYDSATRSQSSGEMTASQTDTSRMFPTPEQIMQYDLLGADNPQSTASEGVYSELLSSTMNWEQEPHDPPTIAHTLPSQRDDASPRPDLWIPQSSFGAMDGPTAETSGDFQSNAQGGLSPQESRIVDDTMRARERDRRRKGSNSHGRS